MTAAVIPFPAASRRRVRRQTGERQRLAEIDDELRVIEHAIASLGRRRRSVLARYRVQLQKNVEAGMRAPTSRIRNFGSPRLRTVATRGSILSFRG
jgi:hypothetical protein